MPAFFETRQEAMLIVTSESTLMRGISRLLSSSSLGFTWKLAKGH